MSEDKKAFGIGSVDVTIVSAQINEYTKDGEPGKKFYYASITGKNTAGLQLTGPMFFSDTIIQKGNNTGKTVKELAIETLKKIGMTDPRRINDQLKGKAANFVTEWNEKDQCLDVKFINALKPSADMDDIASFFVAEFDMSAPAPAAYPEQVPASPPESQSGGEDGNPFDQVTDDQDPAGQTDMDNF